MKTAELNSKVFPYILDAIDSEAHEVETTTEKEKLAFLYETFKKEYCFPENLRRYGNETNVMKEWIMGLPSVFNIDFEYYRIIEIAKEWGSIPQDAKEWQEDKVIRDWFKFIANKTFQLFRKHKIA